MKIIIEAEISDTEVKKLEEMGYDVNYPFSSLHFLLIILSIDFSPSVSGTSITFSIAYLTFFKISPPKKVKFPC